MKTSKLRFTSLCAGNSPVTGEFPAQRASNAEKKFPFDDVIMLMLAWCLFGALDPFHWHGFIFNTGMDPQLHPF